jgi:hypothetical protein
MVAIALTSALMPLIGRGADWRMCGNTLIPGFVSAIGVKRHAGVPRAGGFRSPHI